MNRADGKVETEALPSFLDHVEGNATDRTAEEVHEEAETYEDENYEAEGYDDEGYVEGDSEPVDDAEMDYEEPEVSEPNYTRRSYSRTRQKSSGSATPMILGVICWAGAVGLGAAGQQVGEVAQFGITPTSLFMLGGIAFAAGVVRRWINELQGNSGNADTGATEELSAQIGELLERQDNGENAVGDVQHLMMSLQRQDEKTNNLTKAIKMYGKPLMDIANHGTELAATLAQVKTAVDGGSESARAAWSRLESQLKKSAGGEATQELLGRLEVSVQAVAQRLEDTEVRKSLMRLEDASGKAHEQLQQLSSGESVEAATKSLQEQLAGATKQLGAGIENLRETNLGDLDTTVRDIQREMATVATAVAQIQASIRGGAMPKASASAPAPAAPAAPAAVPTAPSAGGKKAKASDDEDGDGYQTGARRSGGKNVLGAIAKLKQMKN